MRVDLHIHTTASDGRWTPQELVAQVLRVGIELFAIADHETVANVAPTAALVGGTGLSFLPGVEISVLVDGRVFHVLGYGVDPQDRGLLDLLQANTARLHWANEENLRRLARAGYPVDLDEYAPYQSDPARGGWRALNYLIDKGICTDARDFLTRLYVGALRPPPPDFPPPADVVDAIRAAGGVPILAHPGASLADGGVSAATLAPVLEFGVAGLECYSSYHDADTARVCRAFCERHGLLITGGSDCHGGFVARPLGVPPVDSSDLRLGELRRHIRR
jgi:predicted metal-dependent phosphoesterase TrpH